MLKDSIIKPHSGIECDFKITYLSLNHVSDQLLYILCNLEYSKNANI